MSIDKTTPEPTLVITPMKKTGDEKHNFGAVVTNLDLDKISGMSAWKDLKHTLTKSRC